MRGSKEEVFGRATPPRGKQTPGHGVRLKPKEERTDTGVGAPEALRAAPAAWSRLLLGVLGAGRSGRDGSGSRARRPQWLGGSGAPGAGCTPTRSPLAARCGAVGPSASEGAACWDGTGRDGTGRDGTGRDELLPLPCPRHQQPGPMRRPQRGARGACARPTTPPARFGSALLCPGPRGHRRPPSLPELREGDEGRRNAEPSRRQKSDDDTLGTCGRMVSSSQHLTALKHSAGAADLEWMSANQDVSKPRIPFGCMFWCRR
ncbi:uncharacterized protein [Anas platyrhynchos]|uniref:uncharacterized protein isoform X2 n=1 Tax=Anas platyrhynchos TaxID=8839 RepID=UPI003AF31140